MPASPYGSSSTVGQTRPGWHLWPMWRWLWGMPSDTLGLPPTGVSTVVSRKEWGADTVGCCAPLALPVDYLIMHHVPGLECHNQTGCSQRLRELRAHHVRNGWCDVAYK